MKEEIYYTIECVPQVRKSWALWRHDSKGMYPVAFFRTKELALLTKKELAK